MIAVIILTLAAALLRIPLLTRPMGSDEAATFIYYASHPLPVALTIYGSPNNHILHSILMHAAYRIFGSAEWALRLPAFLAGVAIVPLTYFAALGGGQRTVAVGTAEARTAEGGRTAGGGCPPRGALIAAALAASAPVLIDYSTDARGYTILCCCVLVCIIALQRGAFRTFAVAAALGFYAVPVMLYPFEMLVAWGRRKAIRPAIAALVLAAALYAPALIVSGVDAITSNPYVRPLAFSDFLRGLLPYLGTVRAHLFAGIPIAVQIVLAIGFLVAVRKQPIWIGITIVAITIAIQRVLPFPRVWLPFLILFFITAAAAWPWERNEPIVAAAIVIALGLAGFTGERLRETGELRAVREIARELNVRAQPGDPLLALPPSEMPIAFYCRRVEALNPDLSRRRLFVVENRDYGQSLAKTLAAFRIDPRTVAIRKVRDFGSAALYELRR